MPGRLRQTAARTSTAAVDEGAYNIPGLQYNEPLSWRAGKAIAVSDLFARLQKLSNELKEVDPEKIDPTDVRKLAHDLVNPNLIGHKDKGIRAWAISCVVSILNICAPTAPYETSQLKDIFTVVVNSILPALSDPGNAYNDQHVFILNSLVDTSSIVLIGDLPDNEQLLSSLFRICFDIVSGSGRSSSGAELAKSVEFQIGRMLVAVVDECNIPQDAIDLIIAQFLRVDPRSAQEAQSKKKSVEHRDKNQATLMMKDYPPAYNMAKSVCTSCSDKMAGAISHYFSAIITNASTAVTNEDGSTKQIRRTGSPDSDAESDDGEAISDLRKSHRLVRELWRACPDVLVNVIPQLEIELAADAVALRELAVTTIGDIVAGIGLAGLPQLPALNPAAFPLPTIEVAELTPFSSNPLLIPSAPKPFIHVYSSTYQAFFGRRIDKANAVRVAWTQAASKILFTNAGGIGLSADEQKSLLSAYAQSLRDPDDHVRLAALQSVELFNYHKMIDVLASDGGLSQSSSLLHAIAERTVDKRSAVRDAAMILLGKMWGVASRDIANGVERVISVLGQAPSKLLTAVMVNDVSVTAMVDSVLYESLLPWTFPSSKGKDKLDDTATGEPSSDPDSIRARRLLTLLRGLDEKAKPIFFAIQKRQADMARGITQFLKICEDHNGGVVEDADEKKVKDQLERLIDLFSKQLPDQNKAAADLRKFAMAHDRRNYQLIRFAIGAEYDFRTVTKAIRELSKRIKEGATASTLDTLTRILYRCALLCYNRSHVPAIMEFTGSPDSGLAEIAQEVLGEISSKMPEVLRSHIQVLCKELQESAPSDTQPEGVTAGDALKACAAFAKQYPADVPKDRKFITALTHYVLYSQSPRVAKHATSIILRISDKREHYAKEIVSRAIKRFRSNSANQLSQLAAIAQVCLIVPHVANAEEDTILQIALTDILHMNRRPVPESEKQDSDDDLKVWSDEADDETQAKLLALRILVNRCRSGNEEEKETFDELANSVLAVLVQIVDNQGEIVPSQDTPPDMKNQLRLAAVKGILKLCRHKPRCEDLITPQMFESVAYVLVTPPHAVRRGLVNQLKKYLSQNRLSSRWTTHLFLLAFEPDHTLYSSTLAWLRSRTAALARAQKQGRHVNGDKKPYSSTQNTMELSLARLLSLLVHHPDYPLKDSESFDGEIFDFAKYIIFYLQAVATEENLSLIFHMAQRVKQVQDALQPDNDEIHERLYLLSDLTQATIRNYADLMPVHTKGVNVLQTYPGRAGLPTALFKVIPGHTKAQEVAEKNFLPEEVAVGLEQLVRKTVRAKQKDPLKSRGTPKPAKTPVNHRKRRNDASGDDESDMEGKSTKRARKSFAGSTRKTPSSKKRKSAEPLMEEQPSRKSARASGGRNINYIESDDEEGEEDDDAENIVRYKPAPIVKRTPGRRKTDTPEIEGDSEDDAQQQEDDVDDGDADNVASPTPRTRLTKKSSAQHSRNEDVNEGEEDEASSAKSTPGKENRLSTEEDDAVVAADIEMSDAQEDEETSEVEQTTPLKESDNGRKSRANARNGAKALSNVKKGGVVSKPNPKSKAKTKAKSPPPKGSTPFTKAKTGSKKTEVVEKEPDSTTARRSTRKGKA